MHPLAGIHTLAVTATLALVLAPRIARAQPVPFDIPPSCVSPAVAALAVSCPGLPAPTPDEIRVAGDRLWSEQSANRAANRAASNRSTPPMFAPRPLTETELTWVRTASAALCGQIQDPAVALILRYRRAYTYYRANHFEEAAVLFRDIVRDGPQPHDDERIVNISADLLLDSLNVLGRLEPTPRPDCLQAIHTMLPAVHASLCRSGDDPELCDRLESMICQSDRLAAEALSANGDPASAAEAFLTLSLPTSPCVHSGLRPDETLYNAGIEFDRAGLFERAAEVRQTLFVRFGGQSHWVVPALLSQAERWLEQGDRARAATWFEHCAQAARGGTGLDEEGQAREALARAAELRDALGDRAAARRDRARLRSMVHAAASGRSR